MGRRQAAEPHARGVEGRRNSQATDSIPRGLNARAFAKETGALAVGVLNSAVAALPANIFSIWMNFSGSVLASWWGRTGESRP